MKIKKMTWIAWAFYASCSREGMKLNHIKWGGKKSIFTVIYFLRLLFGRCGHEAGVFGSELSRNTWKFVSLFFTLTDGHVGAQKGFVEHTNLCGWVPFRVQNLLLNTSPAPTPVQETTVSQLLCCKSLLTGFSASLVLLYHSAFSIVKSDW